MLIDRHIGMDDEEGEGIMGDKFSRELLFLDTQNKSGIEIWINSPGGKVVDADQIVSSILKSKTKVDTYNIGMCASCAGAIFLAGRNRYMMDYAKFMIHGISGANNNGQSKVFSEGILTNLTTRSKLDETTARQFMSTETWLNADQCEEYGIATKEFSNDFNRPRQAIENNVECWKELKSVVNKLIENKKPHKMKQITNRVKLVEGANEDQIVAAIDAIENRAKVAEGKVSTIEVENSTLKSDIEKLKSDKEALEAKITEFETAKADAEKLANKTEITNMITEAAKLGKIENKVESITAFTAKVENMKKEEVKALLDVIPAKVTAANIQINNSATPKTFTAMDINNQMLEKLNKRN